MSTFFQGLQFGFAQGMLNNMFGGFSSFGYSPFGFNSFGFSPFGFGSFGFNPFGMGMNFGMSMFSMPMMSYSYSAPSVFMAAPPMSADSFINPRMITYTPETTAEFTDMFIPSYNYNPFLNTDNRKMADDDTKEKAELSEAELLMPHKLCARWSAKDISEYAELTPEFCEKVIEISKRVKCNPDDLMTVMYIESRFNPGNDNDANKKNVGLIQFGSAARKDLKVTKTQLLKMNSMEQLDYVETYLKLCKERHGFSDEDELDLVTLGTLVFRPNYAKKDIIAVEGDDAYINNPWLDGIDTNHNHQIEKKEFEDHLKRFQ